MAGDEAFVYWLLYWRREVHEVDAEIPGARIEHARLETGRRKLNKRVTLAHRYRFRHRHNLPDESACRFADEREGCFYFSVLRKVFRVWEIERAAIGFEPVVALLLPLQRVRHLMNVAQVKRSGVDQDASLFFCCDFEAPQRRLGKRVFHCISLVCVVAERAEPVVACDEQHTRAAAIETDDGAVAELSAVEPDVVRADAGRQRFDVEELAVPLIDLEPDFSGLRVPVKGEEAGKLLHTLHLVSDRLRVC